MNNKYFINKTKNKLKNDDIVTETKKKDRKNRIRLVKRECIDYDMFKFLIKKIKDHEDDDDKIGKMILLNSLLYYTGLRISEVLLINKKNLIELFEKEKYNAYCPKTKTTRLIYLEERNKSLKEEVGLTLTKSDYSMLLSSMDDLKAVCNAREIRRGNKFDVEW